MMRHPTPVYARIILPLGLTLLLGMLATWAIAVKLLTDAIDRRLDEQLDHATTMLAAGAFPFSADLIDRVDRLIEARIALLDADGNVALATGDGPGIKALRTVGTVAARPGSGEIQTASAGGSTWRIALRALPAERDVRFAYVAAVASLDDSRQAARDAAKLLGLAMLVLTAVLAWAGHHFTGLARQSRQAGRGDLASRVAHEIRNPLTAIKMQLQLLEEKATGQDAARIGKLLDEIRRMEMIVESALTLGAPLSLARTSVELDKLIIDLGELLHPSLEHRGIDLQLAAECPVAIDADPDRLRQALINLVNNAADELGSGGIIRLGAAADPEGKFVDITVADSGPGLPSGSPGTQSSKPFGLGLGLAICREIAAAHGGELVTGNSADLGGAKFTIRLPMPIIDHHEHAG